VNLKDVAAAAGVSLGTVSHVLNHPELVRPEKRARVEATIARLGYVPNAPARHLVSGRSDTLAFLIPDASNPYFTDLARALRRAASAVGLSLVLCDAGYDAEVENLYLDRVEEMRARGVFLASPRFDNPRLTRMRGRVKVVFIDQLRDRSSGWCGVTVDEIRGGFLAMDHLLEQGHRRTAYAGGARDVPQVRDRIFGAESSLVQRGLSVADLTVITTSGMTMADGREAAARLLELPHRRRPTGVFCGNDLVALGLIHELLRHGVRVPSDVAVVGYDNIEFARSAVVPLTSVAPPVGLLGGDAVELLVDECENEHHKHRQLLHAPELVVRESSTCLQAGIATDRHPSAGNGLATGTAAAASEARIAFGAGHSKPFGGH